MGQYVLRRLLIAVPSLLGISLVLFVVLALAPGDPFSELATNPNVPPEVAAALRAAGMRVEIDLRNEKINYKVREHSLAHTPLILAVGRRDVEARTVAVRRLGRDKQETLELGSAVTTLSTEARPPS